MVGAEEGGPVTHAHPQDEGFYLLDGSCTFYAGGQTITAGAGTFVAVPRYTEHAFVASAGARLINFYLPAGFEMIVAGLGVPALRDGPPKPDEFSLPPRALVEKLGADYGQIPVHGTPFADPPLKQNMQTSPLLGAKALPLVAHADGAPAYWSNGVLWSVLADASNTDGSYTLFEELCPGGLSVPAHVHLYSDEVFYMLDGVIEFMAGGIRAVASKGTLVFVPKGTVHALKVRSERARLLNLYTQPGFERIIKLSGRLATARTLPPMDLEPNDVSASRRAELFAEVGMQTVAVGDPFD